PGPGALARALEGGGVGEREGAHIVAEGVGPLGEGGGEVTGAPAAGAGVPGVGDEDHIAQHGVGAQGAQQRMVAVEALLGAEQRSEEHTSELQSRENLVCRLLLEKKNIIKKRR